MKSFNEEELKNPELLMLLRVLLLRRIASGVEIRVDGELVDTETIQRVINHTSNSRLALICDHLLCVVPDADRPKYGDVLAKLLRGYNREDLEKGKVVLSKHLARD